MSQPEARRKTGPTRPVLERADFDRIAAIAYEEAGLAIAPGKAAMVHTRLARRLRHLNMTSYHDYYTLVASREGAGERREMISALTTNVSHFFREDHHFDRLRQDVLPPLLDRLRAGGQVRLWSAGCSNGQEPFSIAMTILETGKLPSGADLKILATDIDPKVIAFARAGVYPENMMSGLPDRLREQHFTPSPDHGSQQWQVSNALRAMVSPRELNLLHDWPMRGKFDVIFCRNVVIYFDEKTQNRLWRKFANALHPGGWLFLGHSERVSDNGGALFHSRGLTAYQRNIAELETHAKASN